MKAFGSVWRTVEGPGFAVLDLNRRWFRRSFSGVETEAGSKAFVRVLTIERLPTGEYAMFDTDAATESRGLALPSRKGQAHAPARLGARPPSSAYTRIHVLPPSCPSLSTAVVKAVVEK